MVSLRIPGKYTSSSTTSTVSPPSLDWLHHKWTVTHSTLKRWRTAQNLSITYGGLPATAEGSARISDVVAYQAKGKGTSKMKTISGADTVADSTLVWNWRGAGLLKPISCRWEIIGWGERSGSDGKKERWMVTWFAPTLFTEEGLDIYSDREEGMSEELAGLIKAGLEGLQAKELAELVKENLKDVHINVEDLPQRES
jgi:hypothetical protein